MPIETFRYSAIKIHRGAGWPIRITYRPMVAAKLIAADGTFVESGAVVDSGADACLFPLKVALGLGFDPTQMPKSMTGGVGTVSNVTYHATVTLQIGTGIRFTTEVGFTEGMNRAGFGLLGQQGFFENYNVEFRQRERIFTIASEEQFTKLEVKK